ncbi:phosphatase PAP2 family protein [Paucilactobacillus kaifaensis]|uniref:phosphatase PAP2 family protein n=1 Tax=Paucilactobacillus kaifaensis TaxID=2559921 RepID=UPI0010F98F13|nr:phosphatase PAP2 family protein [Paucilactobacillus kaifaensis]
MKLRRSVAIKYWTMGIGSFLLFLWLGLLVLENAKIVQLLDNFFKRYLYGQHNDFLTVIFMIHTMVENLIILAIVIGILVLIKHKWLSAGWLTLNVVVSTGLAAWFFKYIYQRARPSHLHHVTESGFSFPSAHAAFATALFVTLIVIISRDVKSRIKQIIDNGLLLLVMIIICLSRVYLGVHYASDILGGMILSISWILVSFPFYYNVNQYFMPKIG